MRPQRGIGGIVGRIGEQNAVSPRLCRIADERGIAAGAAILPDQLVAEPGSDKPARSHIALIGPWTALGKRQLLRGGNGPIAGLQAHLEKLQQVVRRRTKRAGAGKRRKVPVRDGRKARVVAARQTLLHRARKRDARVVHAERRANARDDELLVAPAAAQLEDMAEQAEAEIGIFVMLARLEAELVVRQVVVEPLGACNRCRDCRDPSARNWTASAAGPTCRSQDQAG